MERCAVILAGGLGTRLLPVTRGRMAKVMVPVLGRPFIDYKLASLRRMGVTRVVMLVGVGGDQVEAYVGGGSNFGLSVLFRHDGDELLGTAGAIAAARDALPSEFWVTYGDNLVRADLDDAEERLRTEQADGAMTVLQNCDRWETSNVSVADGRVVEYRKDAPIGSMQWIDYGLTCFTSDSFDRVPQGRPTDLAVVTTALIEQRRLVALPVFERFWEVGSLEGLAQTELMLRSEPAQWAP